MRKSIKKAVLTAAIAGLTLCSSAAIGVKVSWSHIAVAEYTQSAVQAAVLKTALLINKEKEEGKENK